MERELKTVQQELSGLQESYGRDMLDLVIAARYISKLLANGRANAFLEANHPDILREFRTTVSAMSLEKHDEEGRGQSASAGSEQKAPVRTTSSQNVDCGGRAR